MKNMIFVLMLCVGSFLPVYAAGQEVSQNPKESQLDVNDWKAFKKTEAFKKLSQCLHYRATRDNYEANYDPIISFITDIETWRKKYKLDMIDVCEIFLNGWEEYLDLTKNKQSLPKDLLLSFEGLRYYGGIDEKKTIDLLQKVIAVIPDRTTTAISVYLDVYPNCIFDDEYIRQIMLNPETDPVVRLTICKSVIEQYDIEEDQIRKKELIDKAFEWALLDANIVYFHRLDRFLLVHKENYADLPARKVQLEKELACMEQKDFPKDNKIYRRTKAAIENFGKGPEAQKIVQAIDAE